MLIASIKALKYYVYDNIKIPTEYKVNNYHVIACYWTEINQFTCIFFINTWIENKIFITFDILTHKFSIKVNERKKGDADSFWFLNINWLTNIFFIKFYNENIA